MASNEIPKIALTPEHRERFRREAPEALRRRGPEWLAEQAWGPGELALTAIVSLAGLLFFGWSAPGVLVFTLACVWMGTLCDTLKMIVARRAVLRDAALHSEDCMFWGIADAIRNGRPDMRADVVAPYKPGMGLLIDYVFGGIASFMILVALEERPLELVSAVAAQPGLRIALLATLAMQLLAAIAAIVRHGRPGDHSPMRFRAGARGLGLFLLMFLTVLNVGGSVRGFVIGMNVVLLLLAALSARGFSLHRAETTWLRGQVAKLPRG